MKCIFNMFVFACQTTTRLQTAGSCGEGSSISLTEIRCLWRKLDTTASRDTANWWRSPVKMRITFCGNRWDFSTDNHDFLILVTGLKTCFLSLKCIFLGVFADFQELWGVLHRADSGCWWINVVSVNKCHEVSHHSSQIDIWMCEWLRWLHASHYLVCVPRGMDGSTVGFRRWDENQPNTAAVDNNCVIMTYYMGE